jgi:hypothetical protein
LEAKRLIFSDLFSSTIGYSSNFHSLTPRPKTLCGSRHKSRVFAPDRDPPIVAVYLLRNHLNNFLLAPLFASRLSVLSASFAFSTLPK